MKQSSFAPYPKYKPSGIEWLGEVPEHWYVKRLRFLVTMNPSKQEVSHLPKDTEVSFLPMEAVGDDGMLDLERTRPMEDAETGYTYFAEGDVTYAKITPCFENGKGAVMHRLVGGLGFGTTELTVLRPSLKVNSQFLYYLTISSPFRELGEGSMYGAGGQKRVPDDFARNFSIGWPDLTEQRMIANFLDKESGIIDTLIEKKRRMIGLLKEKRIALISHVVTKGLDPNVKMKDSGIEWLGDVPEYWVLKRLKFLCNIQTGDKDTENAIDDGLYPFFVRSQTVERINTFTYDCEAILTAGDGVGVGKVFHYHNGPFDFHQRVYMLNNFRFVFGPFLYYFLKENFGKVALEGGAKSTVDSLRMPLFLNFPVPLPSLTEQRAISDYLDRETTKIDRMIEKIDAAIEKLMEYRMALITAAVTGKIDVREVAA